MPRKIYDIKPPRVARKTENDIKEFLKTDKKKKPYVAVRTTTRQRYRKDEKHFPWKAVSLVGVLATVALCGILYFKLPKATIEIWPSVQTLNYTQTIKADKTANNISVEDNLIPAKFIEVEKTDTREFSATGSSSDGGTATGIVVMYNTSATTLTLKIGTHILSDSGKYFTTLSKISIPGGSKAKPGSAQVKVQAVETGENYNIGPANFSVPKLSGTAYYYSTYAVSKEAMTGGSTGKIKKITDDDVYNAENSLAESVSAASLEEIKSDLGDSYIIVPDAISYKVQKGEPDTKVGATSENFKYTATVKTSVIAFRKSDLETICKDYIISQMGSDKSILDSSFAFDYKIKSVDILKGSEVLDVSFSSGTYKTINKNTVAISSMGKTEQQIKESINSNLSDSASRVSVDFWPFWVKKAPNSQKSIKIELKF